MWWKAAFGLPLTSICFACELNFWATVKGALYRRRLLTDLDLLASFIRHLGDGWIAQEGERIRPQTDCHCTAVLQLSQRNSRLLNKTGQLFLAAAFLLAAIGYALHPYFLIADALLFLLASVPPRTRAMTNYVLDEIYLLVLHLYKWNLEAPQDCSTQIASRVPGLTGALQMVRRIHTSAVCPNEGRHAAFRI